jgi:F-type H+-transporting ATPase subunit delta
MTSRAAAVRYARALFDVAQAERQDVQQLQKELTGFSALVTGNAPLMRALTHPAIPVAKKRAVVEQLIARVQTIQPQLAKLLLLLAAKDRLVLLPDVAQAFQNRLLDHFKVVRAEVVTAVALPADRVNALKAGLAQATGRQVQLETRVDPGIIGGAITRVGSTVYDGSVTRQLERMREALTNATD